MRWIAAGTFLLLLAVLLRWILRLNPSSPPSRERSSELGSERESIYQPVAQEIIAQSAILGVSLNDAIEERDAGQPDIAWRLVRLAVSEWDRLAEILGALNTIMAEHLGSTRGLPSRPLASGRFKSPIMIDFVRTHDLFDQLVFRSRLRFQLQLRLLRRANDALTAEIRRSCRVADSSGQIPSELWENLDYYFHDFDLVAKETALCFRTLLACLPHPRLQQLRADTEELTRRGVCAKVRQES